MSLPPPYGPSRHGFTLIEILVAIGVTLVLGTLLVVGARSALDKASSMKCLSNWKQMGVAVVGYTADNDGALPSANYAEGYGGIVRIQVEPYLLGSSAEYPNDFEKYLATLRIGCTKSADTWTYGFNSFMSRMKIHAFSKPSAQIYGIDLFASSQWFDHNTLSWKVGDLIEAVPKPHQGRVSVLYLDGHVALEKVSDLTHAQATRDTTWFQSSDEGKAIGTPAFDR